MCKICYTDVSVEVSSKEIAKKLRDIYVQGNCSLELSILVYINDIRFELTIKDDNKVQLFFNTMCIEDDVLLAYTIKDMNSLIPFEFAVKEIEEYINNGCKSIGYGDMVTRDIRWHCY